jgi:electron transfer flavoprotein-quinone oxidoreductase
LEGDQGSTTEMIGSITKGMLGYAFMYTNKESIALGIGCAVDDFQRTNIKPYDLLEELKRHPLIRRYIAGSKSLEYSAHLIPEGGYNVMPPLFTDGMLLAGDAAQMINPTHREGSNLAMAAGKMAGETVIEAKKIGNYSASTLSLYRKKLEASFVLTDMKDHKDIEDNVRARREIMEIYPKLLTRAAHEHFNVDGEPKRVHQKRIMKMFLKERGVINMLRDAWAMRQAIG